MADDEYTFTTMSTHPGLGYGWYQKHIECVKYGTVHGSFGSAPSPRYFEKVFSLLGESLDEIKADKLDKAKAKQLHEMLIHGLDRVEKLQSYQESIDLHKFETKVRRKDL